MKKFYFLLAAAIMTFAASASLKPGKLIDETMVNLSPRLVYVSNEAPAKPQRTSAQRIAKLESSIDWSNLSEANKAPIAKAPFDVWTMVGTGSFTDDILTAIFPDLENITVEVEIEESLNTPGLYRLIDPYKSFADLSDMLSYDDSEEHFLYINAVNTNQVYIETSPTGLSFGEYGEIVAASWAGLYLEMGIDADRIEAAGLFGTLTSYGVFKFPEAMLAVWLSEYNADEPWDANENNLCRVKLPGAKDYDITVLTTECVVDGAIQVGVFAGEDVDAIKFIMLPGRYSANAENLSVVADLGTELPQSGIYTFEFEEGDTEGCYSLLASTLDEQGNYQSGAGTFFYYVPDNNDQWASHGIGKFGEDIVASIYNMVDPSEYEAEVQENINTPGFYRVVNPYENFAFAENNQHGYDHNHYIFIHAEDPDHVWIDDSCVGMDMGDGPINFRSMVDDQDIPYDETAPYFGKLVSKDEQNYLITFPQAKLIAAELYYFSGEYTSYVNTSNKLFVEFPKEISGVENVVVNEGEAEYFNLQGIRVANPKNGIFVRRQGSKVTKVAK